MRWDYPSPRLIAAREDTLCGNRCLVKIGSFCRIRPREYAWWRSNPHTFIADTRSSRIADSLFRIVRNQTSLLPGHDHSKSSRKETRPFRGGWLIMRSRFNIVVRTVTKSLGLWPVSYTEEGPGAYLPTNLLRPHVAAQKSFAYVNTPFAATGGWLRPKRPEGCYADAQNQWRE